MKSKRESQKLVLPVAMVLMTMVMMTTISCHRAEHAKYQEQEQHIQRNTRTRTPKSKSKSKKKPCEERLHFSPFSCLTYRVHPYNYSKLKVE